MTAGLMCWCVIDGLYSIATGFAVSVIPKTILTTMYSIGLFQSGALKR